MSILLLLLPVLVVAALLPPLFRRGTEMRAEREDRICALRERKRVLLAAIRELDFDREMGKLSEADHEAERERMKREAAEVLIAIDREEGRSDA
ncbi:MAG: hypothetical protein FJY73_04385 [Candidatus Eisenbacteria bacterium]|nr:hypothetical protein [Candidatus Eisenbacteria bacterium]